MFRVFSFWSFERDRGEGWVWRIEDLFFLMGEVGVFIGVGISEELSDFFGFELGFLLLVFVVFCREIVKVMLDGDLVIWGMRVLVLFWFSL